jgi:hypothetical protein
MNTSASGATEVKEIAFYYPNSVWSYGDWVVRCLGGQP